MLHHLKEIVKNPTMRSWVFFRLTHPSDRNARYMKSRPEYVQANAWSTCFKKKKYQFIFPQLRPVPFKEGDTLPVANFITIQLASQNVKLPITAESISLNPDDLDFKDPEDIEAFFRFSWILHRLEENESYSSIEVNALKTWMRNSSNEDLAWGPYTIAERLANFGIFVLRSRCFEKWHTDELIQFQNLIQKEAKYILRELEYYGTPFTCNHLSNNGRGLMWAALLSENEELLQLGYDIMSKEVERIIQEKGILREGSTHYHTLITRNYIEAFWILKQFNKHDECEKLKSIIDLMVEGVNFLFPQGVHSFIGDISPDFSPLWLEHLSIAWQALGSNLNEEDKEDESREDTKIEIRGWASHFYKKLPLSSTAQEIQYAETRDDFGRIDLHGISLLAHLNLRGHPLLPGHAHRDSGCPVVIYQGKPVLIDLGRPSYTNSHAHYKSAWNHNSILIDHDEHEIEPRGVYGPKFLLKKAGAKPEFTISADKLDITHYGYLKHGITIKRSFQLAPQAIKIINIVEGHGIHKVTAILHGHEENLKQITFPNEGTLKKIQAMAAYEYGKMKECQKWIWTNKVKLPYQFEISIDLP